MGNVSINKANSLYWLGRYAERAYKLSHIIREYYDKMVDGDISAYEKFSQKLGIKENIKDRRSFLRTAICDENCPSSIKAAISQAYGNSVILREQIATETVSYIQLAYNNVMRLFGDEKCRIYDLQIIVDNLMSFWGAVDDYILEDYIRDMIKSGKYVERIDIFTRFGRCEAKIDGCKNRLRRYIHHLDKNGVCSDIDNVLQNGSPEEIALCVSKLFE